MSTLTAPGRGARPPARAPRVTAEQALRHARALAPGVPPAWVPLDDLPGRRLAADVVARHDVPAGAVSAMDGWAVRAADGTGGRRVVGESAAGRGLARPLGSGEACRVSTGALLPAGADAVVRRERGREARGVLAVDAAPARGDDLRPRGDDMERGTTLLAAGTLVAAHEVGVVAAAGATGAPCAGRPRVAVLTTGDELVTPGRRRSPAHVVDSNLPGISAQARAAGGDVCATARAPDGASATRAALARLLAEEPDLLVTVGGVSVGAHDHVGAALDGAGARWAFRGVAMRPGHPVGLAVRDGTVILALPGNPAAAAVCFHLLGRTLLGAGDGWDARMPLAGPVARHPRDAIFVRCAAGPGGARPLERQGPAQLSSLAGARLLAWIPPGAGEAPAGEAVAVSVMP